MLNNYCIVLNELTFSIYIFFAKSYYKTVTDLTLFRMGLFKALMDRRGSKKPPNPLTLLKCHIYPTMMKLGTIIPYLKKIKKVYKSRDTLLEIF